MAGIRKFKIQVVLAFFVCALLVVGCGPLSKSGRPKVPKELAITPAEKNKAKLLKQIDRRFENPEAHFELGQLYQAEGRWTEAEYQYNTTLSFDPVHRSAQAALVKVLLDSGDTAKAQLSADIYMNQVSSSPLGSLKLALAFQGQRLDEYALACYQQALQLAPNSAKINRQIGYYYLAKNDKTLAKEYLTRSFQLDSNQPDVAGELGRLGVVIKVPRKTEKSTKKLDKMVEQSDKEAKR
jgi:tetratricopeptide (TPR) repeat protein